MPQIERVEEHGVFRTAADAVQSASAVSAADQDVRLSEVLEVGDNAHDQLEEDHWGDAGQCDLEELRKWTCTIDFRCLI